jgi:hypothetical protein
MAGEVEEVVKVKVSNEATILEDHKEVPMS